jgi:ribosome-associated protein
MEEKSKSQIKREMHALQGLGEQLVKLSPSQLDQVELPQELREAVLFARNLKKHEARRRQFQYIGVLMRAIDPEPIRRSLTEIEQGHRIEIQAFHRLEAWQDGLIQGNDALVEEFLKQFPDADRQYICQLVRNARKERKDNKPPKAARALFHYLKEQVRSIRGQSKSG